MNNISCPKCSWKPNADDLWQCSCGHIWNTFSTGGHCPACAQKWLHTQCHRIPGCGQWSPHLDWYPGLDEALSSQLEELNIQTAAEYQPSIDSHERR
jgi:hypothetical protein